MTRVVHCKKEPYDVMIDRSTEYGNPFVIGKDGTREEVIQKYRFMILTENNIGKFEPLRGKVLGCWCKLLPCHGDVIVEILEGNLK